MDGINGRGIVTAFKAIGCIAALLGGIVAAIGFCAYFLINKQ